MPAELRERAQPKRPIMRAEAAREQRGDRINVRFVDLTAAQAGNGGNHSR